MVAQMINNIVITNKTPVSIEGHWKFLMFKILMFQFKVPPKTGESGKELQRAGYILGTKCKIQSLCNLI